MAQITSREELERWLNDKPTDWAQVIAARAALRVLPYAFAEGTDDVWVVQHSLDLFRALAISWAARSFPTYDMERAALYASSAASSAASSVGAGAFTSRASAAAAATCNSRVAADAAVYAYNAAAPAAGDIAWANINLDRAMLQHEGDPATASRRLTVKKLWRARPHEGWLEAWRVAAERLRKLDPTYQVWINWYERRIRGQLAAFEIPGDTNRREDKAILARLADATDEDFWSKGATFVNTTLQNWIKEAEIALLFAPEESAPLPEQNLNAIPFAATSDGKIRIDPTRNADALRTDAEALDRYAEVIREAQALLARCRLSNSAARFVGGFENYLAAGGDALADMRPSLFVQRGEKLRQEVAACESGQQDSFLEPIADDLLIDLKGWRSAHNMVVGLDPVLMRLDTAMLGPDVRPTLIAPSELRTFVADADEANILDEGVREIVDEAISLAPAIPDGGDRRTVWSVESVQNLVIEAFSVALQHPGKMAAGAVFTAVAGVSVATWVLGGALVSAKFLIAHRDWIETRLVDKPTWKSLFVQLCDKMEQVTPFKRAGNDDGV